jgi:hypothetical protein
MILLIQLLNWPPISGLDAYLTGGGICIAIGMTLLSIAVFGFLDVPPGSYVQFRLNVKSTPLRVICLILSLGLFAAGIWMILHSSFLTLNPQMTE